MKRTLPLALSLAATLLGCPDGGTGTADAGDVRDDGPRVCDPALCTEGAVGTLSLGEGVSDPSQSGVLVYRELHDGDEVTVVPGFQGGQHIWVILRATDVGTCYVTPRYGISDAQGEMLDGVFGGEFYALPDEPGQYEFLAYAAFVTDPARVHRQEVVLHAEVSDGCGHLIEDDVRVVPIDARLDGGGGLDAGFP